MSHSTSARRPSHIRTSRIRLALSALAAVAVGGMLASGLSTPAFATPPAQIDVTVHLTSKSGAALTGIKIIPFAVADGNPLPTDEYDQKNAATPISGKPGYYDLGSLIADQSYTLDILPPTSSTSTTFSQWLGGVSDSQRAETFIPSVTSFISASLATNATITGKVEGPTGKASKNAVVEAYQYEGSTWYPRANATTNSSGVYSIKDLDPGSYELEFYPYDGIYAPIFSGGQSTLDNATASSSTATYVSVGKTATVNAKFSAGSGTITGTAKLTSNSYTYYRDLATPVAIPVTSMSGSVATGIDFDRAVYGAPSSSKGVWSISNIPNGHYVVKLIPGRYGEPTTYLNNGTSVETLAEAQVYTIAGTTKISTGTTVFDGSSSLGGQLTVEANDSSLQPLNGGTVTAVEESNPYNEFDGTTNQFGYVTLGDTGSGAMEPGEYDLTVVDKDQKNEPSHTKFYVNFDSNSTIINLSQLTAHPGFTGVPSVTQTDTKVGSTFTAVATAARTDATLSYQWLRNGSVIYGANGSAYTATGADVGTALSVRIIASSFGFSPVTATPSMTGTVTEGDAPTVVTDPTISPSSAPVHIGQVLTAKPGTWTGSGLHYSYQWTSNGNDVGTNSPTYVVTKNDVSSGGGTSIGVSVQALRAGYTDSDWASAPITATGVLYKAPVATTPPTLTKKVIGANTVFTVKSGKWSVSGVTLTYTWFAVDQNGTVLPVGNPPDGTSCVTSAPTSCSVPTASLSSNPGPLLVQVAASRDGYMTGRTTAVVVKGTSDFTQTTPESVNVTHNGSVIGVAAIPIGASISVGDTLTPTHGDWSVGSGPYAPEGYKYTWYRTVGAAAPKVVGTSSTYKLTASDYNAAISVIETATSTRFGVTSIALSNALALGTVGLGTALTDHPATVKLSGSPVAGATLTATVGKWPVSGVKTSIKWFGCSDDCTTDLNALGTKSTQKVPAGDNYVYAVVVGGLTGYASATVNSASTHILVAKVAKAPTVTTVTTAAATTTTPEASTFTVHPGTYSPTPTVSGSTPTYAWYVNGVLDPDTGLERDVNSAEKLDAITVTVTYTVGNTTLTTHLVAQKGQAKPIANSIAGTGSSTGLDYGQTLAVSTPGSAAFTTPGVASTVTYQWYSATSSSLSATPKAISGATKSTFTPSTSYIGRFLSVTLRATSTDYGTMTERLVLGGGDSGIALAKGVFGTGNAPTVSTNAPKPGVVVTATHGSGYPSGTTFTYQWSYVGGASIAGATKSTYTVTMGDATRVLQVTVTAHKTDFATQAKSTIVGTVATLPALDTTTDPSIPIAGKVGDTLTANPGVWNTSGVTFTYQWFRNESSSDANNPNGSIPGATASTFVVPSSSYGDEISVQVTAHKAGFSNVTRSSDVIVVGLGTAPVPTTTAKITSKTVSGVVNYAVSTPAWSVDGLSYSYQWLVGGVVPVECAPTGTPTLCQGDTYARTSADNGVLSVVITAARFGYAGAAPVTVKGATLVGTPAVP